MSDEIQRLKELRQNPQMQQLLQAQNPDLPKDMAQWLAKLCLLEGVPFEHLVPDKRMLPEESIRFFYVDRNWLDAMVDGALSLGSQHSGHAYVHNQLSGVARRSTDVAMRNVRSSMVNGPAPETTVDADLPVTGMLIRSAVISGWPGLEIKPYSVKTNPPVDTNLMTILRMDRLSPTVMLCLFEGVPAEVIIAEPSEGLQYGFEDPLNGNWQIGIRTLKDGPDIGKTIPAGDSIVMVPVVMRDGGKRVLKILDGGAGIQPDLKAALKKHNALPADGNLNPGGFAIQMLQAPQEMIYEPAPQILCKPVQNSKSTN